LKFKPSTIFQRIIQLSFLIILLFSWNGQAHAASEAPISLDDYWHLIQELQANLDAQPDLSPNELGYFADQLAAIEAVSLPTGETIPLDHSYLVAEMRREDPDQDQISQYLSAVMATLETWAQTDFSDASTILLEEILSGPEFQWKTTEPSPLSQWINGLLQRFLEFLSELFPEETGEQSAGGGIPGLDMILTMISILAVILILGFVLQQLASGFVEEASREFEDDPEGEVTNSRSAYQRARQLSQGGDYRSAVRYLYLSSLLLLEERRLLRYDRAKTNREYLRDLSEHPELEEVLEDVVGVYDRVWYGHKNLEEEDFDQFSDRVSDLNKLK
jgi:hypothetical protein